MGVPNIINAIYNLVKNPVVELGSFYSDRNRANSMGGAFELYIKDLFAGTFNMTEEKRKQTQKAVFSYLGNNRNPPDAMVKGGDAIEIKKIENENAVLALNSSLPKRMLKSDSPMISSACRDAESWTEKDMIYAIGVVKNNNVKHLAMVYGLDYCACEECYGKIKNTIKGGIETIPGVELAETTELGRINKVDPLGITYMRVRGMWGIENPWTVFDYVYKRDMSKKFTFMCIINDAKWALFDNTELLTSLSVEGFSIEDIEIRSPNNPAMLVPAKLIAFNLD